jgi:hypothetical protein
METIYPCTWKVGNSYWEINIPDYTNQNPQYLAEMVVRLILDKDQNKLSNFFNANELDVDFEEYIYVANDKTDDVYEFLSEEIINTIKNG